MSFLVVLTPGAPPKVEGPVCGIADEDGPLRRYRLGNIRFAVLKGIPLAVLLHGDMSRRESNDIDLIVQHSDRVAAEDILEVGGLNRRSWLAPAEVH